MISVKGGTQTWSNAQQRTDFKSDGLQNVSATDREKFLQDEPVGDLLNKVADPNWVDPGKKMRTAGNNELGKDAFMTLLLTQMKNQDPTNPLKSHEMAAQLAQFTSLEKLHNINEGIEGLRKEQQPNHNFQALSFIGKTVTTDNGKIARTETDARHDVRFHIPADAGKVTMQIKDAAGNVVRTLDFKGLKAGKNELEWNGLTEEGTPAPAGDYNVSLEATASNGRKLFVETRTEGVITGVNFTARGPQLMIGKQVINMSDVKSISEPGLSEPEPQAVSPLLMGAPTSATASPTPSPTAGVVKPESKPNSGQIAKPSGGNLNDLAMAQGLINKLNKEGAKAGMSGS
ncbi:MAG: flagellar hook assembly protein FlgD [Bdellovibrionales bacterium]